MRFARIMTALALLGIALGLANAAGDLPTKFSNFGTIGNTRHNLTQRQASGGGPAGAVMDTYRNNYGEVCVYCHTPHGANTTNALPLWNRTMKVTSYTLYSQLGTSTLQGEISQPGNSSLACLSCHDGQTAVDSIINMPGSGRYLKSQGATQSDSFLNTWVNPDGNSTYVHASLSQAECLACHSSSAGPVLGAGAADFTVAAIGTNLKDDHPVGIVYPSQNGPETDFNKPFQEAGSPGFFDVNANRRMDANDVRLYFNGERAQVECASCHDPHGVPSGDRSSPFIRTFLRVTNEGNALCFTCHAK